jgi:hypothetical protein
MNNAQAMAQAPAVDGSSIATRCVGVMVCHTGDAVEAADSTHVPGGSLPLDLEKF